MIRSKSITAEKQGYTILYVKEIPDEAPDYEALLKDIRENIYLGETDEGIKQESVLTIANDDCCRIA
jgi:hypothetical protein